MRLRARMVNAQSFLALAYFCLKGELDCLIGHFPCTILPMSHQLAALFTNLAAYREAPDLEGTQESGLPGVRFFRTTHKQPRQPLVYRSGLVIIVQGRKVGHLGGRQFTYGEDSYLILSVPMPFECETFASPDAPLMGLFIDVNAAQVQSILDAVDDSSPDCSDGLLHFGLEPSALDQTMSEITARLLRCLTNPEDLRVLGPGICRELIYRALQGPNGKALVALTRQQSAFARIARALDHVHRHYAAPIAVEDLAHQASMSVSAFFRAFAEVTGDSPLQYIKKIRLDKAMALLRQQDTPVSAVAYEVGYESPSQFSREFKRHFSASPTSIRSRQRSGMAIQVNGSVSVA